MTTGFLIQLVEVKATIDLSCIVSDYSCMKLRLGIAYTGQQSSAIFGSGRQASAKPGIQTAEGEPYSRSLNNLTITDKGSCQGCKTAPEIKKCGA